MSRISNKDIKKETKTLYGKTKFTTMRWEVELDNGIPHKHPDDDENIEESCDSSKKSKPTKMVQI